MTGRTHRLTIRDFAHVRDIDVRFGDLTVFVGPQASGKSIALQLWKLVRDRGQIVKALRDHGFVWQDDAGFLEHALGEGWAGAWRPGTRLAVDGHEWSLSRLRTWRGGRRTEGSVFYVPAHRTLVFDNGWPRLFQQFPPDTPVVVRLFSQALHGVMNRVASGAAEPVLFPHQRRMKGSLRRALDEAAFHGGRVRISRAGRQRRLVLDFGLDGGKGGAVPFGFMSWTTGQRELVPLLLAFHHLLPAGRVRRRAEVQWVVVEEPELGLHPRAVLALFTVFLDLLHRGCRVVVSTHAPVFLDAVFAIRMLRTHGGTGADLLRALGHRRPGRQLREAADAALGADIAVHAFGFDEEGRVRSTDISSLDPGARDEATAGWGGLTGLSSRIMDVVAERVAAAEADAERAPAAGAEE